MSEDNRKTQSNPDKRGIFLTSKSPITLKIVKGDKPPINTFVATYAASSSSPISISFDENSNYFINIAERSESESDSETPVNPTKKQRRQEEKDLARFWQSETGMLPEILTRVPKTDNARQIQHTLLMESNYVGKSYLASARTENDRLAMEVENKEKESDRLRAKVVELQMRLDMIERKLRNSPESNASPLGKKPSEAVTPPNQDHQSRKSPPKYQIAPGTSPNASIFNHMLDDSVRADDKAVMHVKRKPQPLMGLSVSPPTTGSTTPSWNLRGTGHFSFASRGRGGQHHRGQRQQIRGRGGNRYEDAVASHRWQQATFSHPTTKASDMITFHTVQEGSSISVTSSSTSTKGSSPLKATTTGSCSPQTSASRVTRNRAKAMEDQKSKKGKDDEEKEREDSDEEQLRIDTDKEDETFMAERLLDDYESMQ